MSYLKNIIQDTFDVSSKDFYLASLDSMDTKCVDLLKQSILESSNSKNHLDSFRREFSTVSIELDKPVSEDEFINIIYSNNMHINAKFDFSYCGNRISEILNICARILLNIDNDIAKSSTTNQIEISRCYGYLRNIVGSASEIISSRLNRNPESFDSSFNEAIKEIAFPYISVPAGTNMPVDPKTMWDILFDQDIVIYDLFVQDMYDDGITESYGPYGELFFILNQRIINNEVSLSKDIMNIYLKTVVTMQLAISIWEDYLFDLQDFCKKYYQACIGEYEFKYNSQFKLSDLNDYPQLFLEYSNRGIAAEESLMKSLEADADAGAMSAKNTSLTPDTTANNIAFDQVDEKYKQKTLKFQKLINDIFRVNKQKFIMKLNVGFFKKWIGRIPSLYQAYSGSAMIFENRMKGDPTQVLLDGGIKYLQEMTNRTESIFNDIITACKKVTSAGNIQAKVNAVKDFCKQYPIEDLSADPKTIKQQIVNEACYRISDAILQDNGVYGYTAEGIVQNKKFPTSNHIVTALFVENAQEKADEQSVGSIFSSPDSLTIFAYPEKFNVLESGFKQTSNNLIRNFNPRMISATQKNMHQNYKLYVNNLSRQASSQGADQDNNEDINQTKKVAKALEDGLIDALDIVIEQKKRCIQCVGSMYEMGGRIANLAKRCIAALHDEEAKHRDNNYNTGSNSRGLNRSTKSLSTQNAYNSGKTARQIKRERMQAKMETLRNIPRYDGKNN